MKWVQTLLIKLFIITAVLGVLGFGGWWAWSWWNGAANAPPDLRTEKVTRGRLVATINSTGTIQPEDVVDVGAQVIGQIVFFGRDPTDNRAPIAVASAVASFANCFTAVAPAGPLLWAGIPNREWND